MFLLTFIIGFIVAFIIKLSVRGVEFSQTIRNERYHLEMKRLRSIKRIRSARNTSRLRKIEEASGNKVLNYYYGKYNRQNESKSTNETNELINHYYGKN